MDDRMLWTDDDLARFLRVSKSKIRADRAAGRLPFRVLRFGRTVRYNPDDVRDYVKNGVVAK
jgi:hypothetical protein